MTESLDTIRMVGLNHRDAPVEVREQMAVPVERQGEVTQQLVSEHDLDEGVLISTCNRVEIYYATGENPGFSPERLTKTLAEWKDVNWQPIRETLYTYRGEKAVHHLFRVAGSLDSMVVGETQIINQVKTAYNESRILGLTGKRLNPMFQEALSLAKEIQEQTEIGERKVSVSSVAVDFVSRVFEDLSQKTVMLVGAGETARICLENLREHGVEDTIVCNRSRDRAEDLASSMDAKPVKFELLEDYMERTDVLIVATSSESPIIGVQDIQDALRKRDMDPICILDLSVPRNVHPDCEHLDQVYLYNIDDLEQIVAQNLEARSDEIEASEKMVDERLRTFVKEQKRNRVGPLIKELREELKEIGEQELSRSLNRVESLKERDEEEIRKMVDRLLNKILHSPVTNLKDAYARGDGVDLAEALQELFEIDPGASTDSDTAAEREPE